jgi:hypothetical protein
VKGKSMRMIAILIQRFIIGHVKWGNLRRGVGSNAIDCIKAIGLELRIDVSYRS